MRTRTTYLAISAAILGAMVIACDSRKENAFRSPTAPPPVTPEATLVRVELLSPGSIAPGESVQLTATAIKSDGSVANITAVAQWTSSDNRVVEISAAGVARGIARGEALLTLRYQTRGATKRTFVLPAGTHRLNGRVTDSGFGVAGATVTVIAGVGEDLTTVTDGQGMYALYGVRDRVRLQAKGAGYINRIEEIDVPDHRSFNLEMVPAVQRPDLRGDYRLTIARMACPGAPLIPETRSYDATVDQDGARLTVTLSGADFILTRGHGNGFRGFIDMAAGVTFGIGRFDDYYYYLEHEIVERIGPARALIVSGRVTAELSPIGITGVLNGTFLLSQDVLEPFRPFGNVCAGAAHRFEMARR